LPWGCHRVAIGFAIGQLLGERLELEVFGGDMQLVQTAARKGEGLDALEEALLLQVRVRHCHV
jgi:translation initiation factor IF-2